MEIDPAAARKDDDHTRHPTFHTEPDTMDTSLDQPGYTGPSQRHSEHLKELVNDAESHHAHTSDRPQDRGTMDAAGPAVHISNRPHPTHDLLSRYGLQQLVASVARTDPVTGAKINKMRSSYEGYIKTFGLAGRNKAVTAGELKDNQHGPMYLQGQMSLLDMLAWPEEEWYNQKVAGKDVEKGLSDTTKAKLHTALQMLPGRIPNAADPNGWEEVLGHEKPKTAVSASKMKPKPSVATTLAAHSNGGGSTLKAMGDSEAIRPKRMGRKRRYDDLSFEGYGEGYVDDDADIVEADEYSSGDGERRGSTAKKRKKSSKDYGAAGPTLSDRGGSYGVGMIGVGGYSR